MQRWTYFAPSRCSTLSEFHHPFLSCLKCPHCFVVAASGPGAAGFGHVFSTAPAVASAPAASLFGQVPQPEFASYVAPSFGSGSDGAASSQTPGALPLNTKPVLEVLAIS